MKPLLILAATALIAGCAFRVAKSDLDEGFNSQAQPDGRFLVSYNGRGMESREELERLLRVGVKGLCGSPRFSLTRLTSDTYEAMHRWRPVYRRVEAIAVCAR